MKALKCIAILLIFLTLTKGKAAAQDPSFSQFFSSPLNINPALTANINSDWRMIANLRDQWVGSTSPYMTGTVSFDTKLQHKMNGIPEGNIWGAGVMLMTDKALNGAVKSNYASLNVSYSMKLSEGISTHRIYIGFGGCYGSRNVDLSKLDFEEQFTGGGFNTSLPTGETSFSNTKDFLSLSSGISYRITGERSNFDIGVAGFHLNQPKQSFLNAADNLPIRKVVHTNFETLLNDRLMLSTSAIYQQQLRTDYLSFGGALGYFIGEGNETVITSGLWYWSKNALIPYLGFGYKNLQVGFSYDLTTSKLNSTTSRPNTCEVSLILRGNRTASKVIYCPWK